MSELQQVAGRLADVETQIDIIKVVQDVQPAVARFRENVMKYLEPSTGDAGLDHVVGETRTLLGQLSETLGGLLEPFDRAGAATKGITHGIEGLSTLIDAGSRASELSGPELVDQFTRYMGHLDGVAQAIGLLNPVAAAYLTALNEGLQGMGDNLRFIAQRTEETNRVIAEERLRALGELKEIDLPAAPDASTAPAMHEEHLRLGKEWRQLGQQLHHEAVKQALIERFPDMPDHLRQEYLQWLPDAWSELDKGHLLHTEEAEAIARDIRERAERIADEATEAAKRERGRSEAEEPPAKPGLLQSVWAWVFGLLLLLAIGGGIFIRVGFDPEDVAGGDGGDPVAAVPTGPGVELVAACLSYVADDPILHEKPEGSYYHDGLSTMWIAEGDISVSLRFDSLPDSEALYAELYLHQNHNSFWILEWGPRGQRDVVSGFASATAPIIDGAAHFDGEYVLNENPVDATGMRTGEQQAWSRFRLAGVAVYVFDEPVEADWDPDLHEPFAAFGHLERLLLTDTQPLPGAVIPEILEVAVHAPGNQVGDCL